MTPALPHLAVALDGAGWHPAAWRSADARPGELFTAGYWTDLVREAERGVLDFVTIEDRVQTPRTDRVFGRLDPTLVAAAVAPRTSGIGLVPTVVATHTEPFHVSKAIASLDYASAGRAGYQVRISTHSNEFGRPIPDGLDDLLAEAADHVEVVRRLWDSWEDDAEIRDAATGRFVDRDKLHYIDFTGRWFSVKGPSITPRPPQGQPPVMAHSPLEGDVVFVSPGDTAGATHVFGELVVFLDETTAAATGRLARLDELDGAESGSTVFAGTVDDLIDLLVDLPYTGFRLWPGALPHDLVAITRGLVPALQRKGLFRRQYNENTLRARLGLGRPANRYEVAR